MATWDKQWSDDDLIPGRMLQVWAYGRGQKANVTLVGVRGNKIVVQYATAPDVNEIDKRRVVAVRVDSPEEQEEDAVPTTAHVALRRIQEMKDMLQNRSNNS